MGAGRRQSINLLKSSMSFSSVGLPNGDEKGDEKSEGGFVMEDLRDDEEEEPQVRVRRLPIMIYQSANECKYSK